MCTRTLPILFINLGGEMMYILDQRLRAQGIDSEKSKKVIHEIVATMFSRRFVEELFKPQEVYSKKALRTIFDRLAHASIMRLNTASMDKLYDLMTMAFKYQVSVCLHPREIILITLNHLDAIRAYVKESSASSELVDHVYDSVLRDYASMSHGELLLIRQTLAIFFQDLHIRVSIFLKDKVQNTNGRFVLPVGGQVPWGCEPPGKIKCFGPDGKVTKVIDFKPGGSYQKLPKEGSLDKEGDRVTKLGANMYNVVRPVETTVMHPIHPGRGPVVPSDLDGRTTNPNSKAQLDLLARLITSGSAGKKQSEFRLNLFSTDEEESIAEKERPAPTVDAGVQVIKIDASKTKPSAELSRIMGELSVDGATGQADDDDLLALMDQA